MSPFRFAPAFSVRPLRPHRGGDEGIRTLDPLLAGQVLSQLSYTPVPLYFRSPGLFPLLGSLFLFAFHRPLGQ